ncbi:hypothetical protein LCGC14_1613750 [marine sediment metagenome]|uniref:DNA 5'-3' helicase n=1 Tax=marine sediment metagenome TaxID=412755 RepID=A0A0F9IUC0_9ZZZZ
MKQKSKKDPSADLELAAAQARLTSIDLEEAILGTILLNVGYGGDAAYSEVSGQLKVQDFADRRHQLIFQAMINLSEAGSAIDDYLLSEELLRQGWLDSVDGVAYVASLTEGLPRIDNLSSYIKVVRNKSRQRELVATHESLRLSALSGDADELGTMLATAIDRLAQIRTGDTDDLLSVDAIVRPRLGEVISPQVGASSCNTGFLALDRKLGGLRKGEMIILGARPSMGKSALALDIAANVAREKGRVAFFSLEMGKVSLVQRLLCREAEVDLFLMIRGRLEMEERRKVSRVLGRVMRYQIFIDDERTMTVPKMLAESRRLQTMQGLDLVIIDYLQIMDSVGRFENANRMVTAMSKGLKQMAGTLDVPVLVLSQLSRESEKRADKDRRPRLSDLRDSGSLEQDADVVMFIYRPEVYFRDRPDFRGLAEIEVAKQRNGPIGTVTLSFEKTFASFRDAAEWVVQPDEDA